MDLSDEKLRAQAQVECIRCEGSGCGVCRDQGKRYIALHDAARAEQREADAKIADAEAEKERESMRRLSDRLGDPRPKRDTWAEVADRIAAAIRSQR